MVWVVLVLRLIQEAAERRAYATTCGNVLDINNMNKIIYNDNTVIKRIVRLGSGDVSDSGPRF